MRRKSPGRVVRALADLMWARDRRQMRVMDKLLAGSDPHRGQSTQESRAVELLRMIQHGTRSHTLERLVHEFVRLLETIPDCAPHELSENSVAVLGRVAEGVIAEIERRVDLGVESDAAGLNLVTSVYKIRRAVEQIDRWHRHHRGAHA